MPEYPVAPDEWECLVFIAVAEEGHPVKAAERLRRMRGTYTRQAVNNVVAKVEAWADEKLFTKGNQRFHLTERGQDFLDSARRVVAQYQVMRMAADRPQVPTLACSPHHTTFVALAEGRLRDPETGEEQLRVEYLGQHQRGESEFLRRAVALLVGDAYQLIVGPAVEDDETLESHDLYSARLEAMVATSYPGATMSITDLVTRHRILVTPPDTRSRRLLEAAIEASGVDDPGVAIRVAAETYETATSVMRLRSEQRLWAEDKSRIVVVPSDVALAYKEGMEFGGRGAERFTWVPIVGADAEELRLQVCVTVKRTDSRRLLPVIRALGASVADLASTTAHGGLSGTVTTPASRVPPQARR